MIMIMKQLIKKILKESMEDIPPFIKRRIDEYVQHTLSLYSNHNLRGNFNGLIEEIADTSINDLLSEYIDSIGYTIDDEEDNYDQSIVDDVYKKYYDTLAEYIQGHYSSEIYRLYTKLKK